MVNVSNKATTRRRAIAIGHVAFSNPATIPLIKQALIKKGDVLSTARLAGIMAAKNCPSLIPLCHPIVISGVRVDVRLKDQYSNRNNSDDGKDGKGDEEGNHVERREFGPDVDAGSIHVESEVECVGQTGVEMEAYTSVSGALLTIIDMVKSVDRGACIGEIRLVLKEGGRSGTWRDERWTGEL